MVVVGGGKFLKNDGRTFEDRSTFLLGGGVPALATTNQKGTCCHRRSRKGRREGGEKKQDSIRGTPFIGQMGVFDRRDSLGREEKPLVFAKFHNNRSHL